MKNGKIVNIGILGLALSVVPVWYNAHYSNEGIRKIRNNLEPTAIWLGPETNKTSGVKYEDLDGNGKFETYWIEPETGKRTQIVKYEVNTGVQ
jgi:hypothetical protein